MCSAFRTFQGWTALSEMRNDQGVLHTVPIPKAMAYMMLRPLLDDVPEDSMCGVKPNRTFPATEQWHGLLMDALSAIPSVSRRLGVVALRHDPLGRAGPEPAGLGQRDVHPGGAVVRQERELRPPGAGGRSWPAGAPTTSRRSTTRCPGPTGSSLAGSTRSAAAGSGSDGACPADQEHCTPAGGSRGSPPLRRTSRTGPGDDHRQRARPPDRGDAAPADRSARLRAAAGRRQPDPRRDRRPHRHLQAHHLRERATTDRRRSGGRERTPGRWPRPRRHLLPAPTRQRLSPSRWDPTASSRTRST